MDEYILCASHFFSLCALCVKTFYLISHRVHEGILRFTVDMNFEPYTLNIFSGLLLFILIKACAKFFLNATSINCLFLHA